MSRAAGSSWWLALRHLPVDLLFPFGAAFAAGLAVASLATPLWHAAGLPYALGYGKNVEAAAILAGFAAAVAVRLASSRPLGRRLAAGVGCAGWIALGVRLDAAALAPALPRLLFVVALLAVLAIAAGDATGASGAPRGARDDNTPRRRAAAAAAAVTALAGLEATLACRSLTIDVFHQGEVLASAVDLLDGGRPFETLVWPHGLHDTGLAALWILCTGKLGTSPVALAGATVAGLGVVAAYLLARRLLASRREALAATLALALAPLLSGPSAASGASPALAGLGVLLFVVIGFTLLAPGRPPLLVCAGAAFGAAHLFRFETAVYGALAAGGFLAAHALLAAGRSPRQRLRALALDGAALACGGLLPLLAGRLLWGWPGAAWFEYLFGDLARHHRDAVGLVLRWPLAGARGLVDPETMAAALAWLLFVTGLLALAAGALAARLREPEQPGGARLPELVFCALFALGASRSALDRIDALHVLQWAALPGLGVLLILAAALREWRGWRAGRSAFAVAALLVLVDPAALAPRALAPVSPSAALARLAAAVGRLGEHLAPNRPAGPCADLSFTAHELRDGENRSFVAATCDVERRLESQGARGLAIADSAPGYWVRFGIDPPYREFSLSRAYTPAAQRGLIEELRASAPPALLLPSGFGALAFFDVPIGVRGPVVEAYLRGRRAGAAPASTPLGTLYFWNQPAPCLPEARAEAPADAVIFRTRRLYHQPASGLVIARGWASERATGAALTALGVAAQDGLAVASVEYGPGSGRPGPPGSEPFGWELFARVPPGEALPSLRLEARLADGRAVRLEVDALETIRLGPLAGAAWRDLAAGIDAAWRLGRADRRAAAGALCTPVATGAATGGSG